MHMARIEAAVRLALEFSQAFNRHDLTALAEILHDNCLLESAHAPGEFPALHGKEPVLRFWEQFFQKVPAAHMQVEEVFGLGSRSVMRWQCEWVDITGRPVRTRGVEIFKVRDGRICEQLSYVKGEGQVGGPTLVQRP